MKYVFVIDTESYAGNFEREMCAYVTGVLGECGVGEEMVELYTEETGEDESRFYELLEQRPDEHGCHRPCYIWPTPGWFNHGHGGHFREGQEDEALSDYVKVASEYEQQWIDQTEKQIIPTLKRGEEWANWTLEDCDKDLKRRKKSYQVVCHLYLSLRMLFWVYGNGRVDIEQNIPFVYNWYQFQLTLISQESPHVGEGIGLQFTGH